MGAAVLIGISVYFVRDDITELFKDLKKSLRNKRTSLVSRLGKVLVFCFKVIVTILTRPIRTIIKLVLETISECILKRKFPGQNVELLDPNSYGDNGDLIG